MSPWTPPRHAQKQRPWRAFARLSTFRDPNPALQKSPPRSHRARSHRARSQRARSHRHRAFASRALASRAFASRAFASRAFASDARVRIGPRARSHRARSHRATARMPDFGADPTLMPCLLRHRWWWTRFCRDITSQNGRFLVQKKTARVRSTGGFARFRAILEAKAGIPAPGGPRKRLF